MPAKRAPRAVQSDTQRKLVISDAFKKVVPKKPLTAFSRWLCENPNVLKKSNAKEAKQQFGKLPKAELEGLETRCAAALSEFKEKKRLTQDVPKKPMSSYQLFCAEKKSYFSKEGAQQWKALSQQEQKVYKDPFAALSEIYKAELEAFKKAKKERRAFKAAAKAKGPETPRKPKRPLSSYFLFSEEKRGEITEKLLKKGQDRSTIMASVAKETGSQWDALSEEERKKYKDQQVALMAEYRANLVGSPEQ